MSISTLPFKEAETQPPSKSGLSVFSTSEKQSMLQVGRNLNYCYRTPCIVHIYELPSILLHFGLGLGFFKGNTSGSETTRRWILAFLAFEVFLGSSVGLFAGRGE